MEVTNRGIGLGIEIPGIILMSLILIGGLIYWCKKEKSIGLLLIIGGGVWNLGERIINGGVRDYWKIPYTGVYNNLADWIIFAGVVVYIWQKIIKKSK